MRLRDMVEQAALRLEPCPFTQVQVEDFLLKQFGFNCSIPSGSNVRYWLNQICIKESIGQPGISTTYRPSTKWLEQYF